MGFFDRFKKRAPAPVLTKLEASDFEDEHAEPNLEEPATLAQAAEQAQRAKFRERESAPESAFSVETEGVPSVNRRRGNSKLVNAGAIVAILLVAGVLVVTVNGSKDHKPKKSKDKQVEAIGSLPPLVMPPAPAPIATDLDGTRPGAAWSPGSGQAGVPGGAAGAIPVKQGIAGSPNAQRPLKWNERKLVGSTLVTESGGGGVGSASGGAPTSTITQSGSSGAPGGEGTIEQRAARIAAQYTQQGGTGAGTGGLMAGGEGQQSALASRLQPTTLKAVSASLLPDRSFMITKGKSIDCALETAIDTTLPGLITCIVTRDVWSDNGSVVLLERGSKMVGEQQGNVKQGQARVFALWDRAETPNGVIINLDSPGADALGRSGLEGWVDNHFAQRFGAAILMTFLESSMSAYIARNQPSGGGTSVFGNTGDAGAKVVEKILDSTVNIQPTIIKNQGDHIQVLVARDLDFSGVYGLQVKP